MNAPHNKLKLKLKLLHCPTILEKDQLRNVEEPLNLTGFGCGWGETFLTTVASLPGKMHKKTKM